MVPAFAPLPFWVLLGASAWPSGCFLGAFWVLSGCFLGASGCLCVASPVVSWSHVRPVGGVSCPRGEMQGTQRERGEEQSKMKVAQAALEEKVTGGRRPRTLTVADGC